MLCLQEEYFDVGGYEAVRRRSAARLPMGHPVSVLLSLIVFVSYILQVMTLLAQVGRFHRITSAGETCRSKAMLR